MTPGLKMMNGAEAQLAVLRSFRITSTIAPCNKQAKLLCISSEGMGMGHFARWRVQVWKRRLFPGLPGHYPVVSLPKMCKLSYYTILFGRHEVGRSRSMASWKRRLHAIAPPYAPSSLVEIDLVSHVTASLQLIGSACKYSAVNCSRHHPIQYSR